MVSFLLRRLAQSVVVLLGVTVAVFVLTKLLPGGAARAILGPRASPLQVRQFVHANGYDRPIFVQFLDYLDRVFLHGDLGFSYKYNQSVSSMLAQNVPKSLVLVGLATLLSVAVAVPLGIFQSLRRNRLEDYAITGISFILYAMPVFWLGFILIDLFAIRTGLLPPNAPQGPSWIDAARDPGAMVLPILTLALGEIALFSRYMRSTALENLAQDYIRTARAKGVPEGAIVRRHLLRNSLIPIITLLGLSLPALVSGAILTETVFNYPGIGLLSWNAALSHDYPVLLGTTLVVGVATVLGSLVADVLYAVLDPRVRYA